MQNSRTISLVIAILSGIQFSAVAQKQTRILWLGSSSTYYHDMPYQVADWLNKTDSNNVYISELAGKSGKGIDNYLEPGFEAEYGLKEGENILSKIENGNYNFIVLQVPVHWLVNDTGVLENAIRTYSKTAKNTGSTVLLYDQGWWMTPDSDAGSKKLYRLAKELKVQVVYCRKAWQRIQKQMPSLSLNDLPDTVHPGMFGNYINISCFYTAISGKHAAEAQQNEFLYWPFIQKENKKVRERIPAVYRLTESQMKSFTEAAWTFHKK